MFKSVSIISILFITILSVEAANHWTYDHEEKWPGICETGKQQSPINLVEKLASEKPFNAFQFTNWDKPFTAILKNNKHSVEVRLNGDAAPTVKGGNLPSIFVLDHMHFHWQSEHTIDGRRYPLELHAVTYDQRYANISMAKEKKGGLAVLGILFNLSPDDVADMQQLVEIIDNIGKAPNKNVNLEEKIIPKDFLPCDTAGFFRYDGSLTTPGCDEVVTWTVFTNKLTLSDKQVKKFQSIYADEGPLTKNYRPLQELHDRRILLKISPINAASTKTISALTTFIVLLTTYITLN